MTISKRFSRANLFFWHPRRHSYLWSSVTFFVTSSPTSVLFQNVLSLLRCSKIARYILCTRYCIYSQRTPRNSALPRASDARRLRTKGPPHTARSVRRVAQIAQHAARSVTRVTCLIRDTQCVRLTYVCRACLRRCSTPRNAALSCAHARVRGMLQKPACLARTWAAFCALWADGCAASGEGRMPEHVDGTQWGRATDFEPVAVAEQYLEQFPEDRERVPNSVSMSALGQMLVARALQLWGQSMPALCAKLSAHAQLSAHGAEWRKRHMYGGSCNCCAETFPELYASVAPPKGGRPKKAKRGRSAGALRMLCDSQMHCFVLCACAV